VQYIDLAERSREKNVMRDMWINQLNAAAQGKFHVPAECAQALAYLSTAMCIIVSLSHESFRLNDWWKDQARRMAIDFVEALDNGPNKTTNGSVEHMGTGAAGPERTN
jgi:hypothetical protein